MTDHVIVPQKKFVIVGNIEITEIEFRNLRRKKNCYKLVNKQWYRLMRKNGTARKIKLAKKAVRILEQKIAKLQEIIDGKSV